MLEQFHFPVAVLQSKNLVSMFDEVGAACGEINTDL